MRASLLSCSRITFHSTLSGCWGIHRLQLWIYFAIACGVWWLMAPVWGNDRRESDLHLANARLERARLLDIAEDNQWEFQIAGQSQPVAASAIVRWGEARPSSGAPLVWLNDGSWLAGQLRWKSPQVLELISDWFVPVELDIDRIRGIIFQPPPSLRQWAALAEEMRRARGAEDAVWTTKEQISGVLTLRLRREESGESGLTTEWTLAKTGRPGLILDSSELRAIVLSPVLRSPLVAEVPGQLSVGLSDGSHLRVASLGRTSQQVVVVLSDKVQLQSLDASRQFAEAIVCVHGNPADCQWLGELEPARYRIITEAGQLNWPLGRDRDLFQQKLWKAGQPVEHGVCMHAPSQVAYRWDGTPGKLIAELSLLVESSDSSVGSIEGKVLVARGGALEEVYSSGVLRPTSPAAYVAIDLAQAQLVVLLVGEADQGPMGDHALWREARLVRQASR